MCEAGSATPETSSQCRMAIRDLVDQLPDHALAGDPQTTISGLSFDTRNAHAGMLFIPLRGGYVDGHQFLSAARAAGAVAALVEPDTPAAALDGYAAVVRAPNTRAALAAVAARWFDHPSRAM